MLAILRESLILSGKDLISFLDEVFNKGKF